MAKKLPNAVPTAAAQRWFARLAVVAGMAAIAVLVVGGARSILVLLIGLAGVVVALAGLWWFLSKRGLARAVGAVLAVAAPLAVFGVYLARGIWWAVLVVLALVAISTLAARAALILPATGMPEHEVAPPRHPFLVMNPRSGGGKVRRFQLDTRATELGAELALLEGPTQVDVAALARRAASAGADLLGVAGGDGTQALVAGIAAERGLPFLVISAGTRNHFAMDLGLDREHPDACLDALTDGVELILDLGCIGGRTFVNNASFGAYAEVVQSPAYRDDKRGTTLQMLPDLLSGHRGPRLVARIDDELTIEAPQALLVSNNPYELHDPAGLGRRTRLDGGVLGVIAVTVDNAVQAAELLRGRRGAGLQQLVAHRVVIESDAAEIPVGVDGEALVLPTPVVCTIEPLALRVRVPRHRPGVPPAAQPLELPTLLHQALPAPRTSGDDSDVATSLTGGGEVRPR